MSDCVVIEILTVFAYVVVISGHSRSAIWDLHFGSMTILWPLLTLILTDPECAVCLSLYGCSWLHYSTVMSFQSAEVCDRELQSHPHWLHTHRSCSRRLGRELCTCTRKMVVSSSRRHSHHDHISHSRKRFSLETQKRKEELFASAAPQLHRVNLWWNQQVFSYLFDTSCLCKAQCISMWK